MSRGWQWICQKLCVQSARTARQQYGLQSGLKLGPCCCMVICCEPMQQLEIYLAGTSSIMWGCITKPQESHTQRPRRYLL